MTIFFEKEGIFQKKCFYEKNSLNGKNSHPKKNTVISKVPCHIGLNFNRTLSQGLYHM
jgi:hypothetical protein